MLAASDLGLEELISPQVPRAGPYLSQAKRPAVTEPHEAGMELSSSKPAKTPNDSKDFQSHIQEPEQR